MANVDFRSHLQGGDWCPQWAQCGHTRLSVLALGLGKQTERGCFISEVRKSASTTVLCFVPLYSFPVVTSGGA